MDDGWVKNQNFIFDQSETMYVMRDKRKYREDLATNSKKKYNNDS
jgi:hypothetical protein